MRLAWLGLIAALSVQDGASAAATAWIGDTDAAVRLVTARDGVAGDTVEAGVQFRFGPGWHGYWRTPGDAGVPPLFDWSGSNNIGDAIVSWPAPARLAIEGLQNAVYVGQVILPVRLRVPRPDEAVRLRLLVDYAACSNICVPYKARLDLTLPAGASPVSAEAAAIAAAQTKVPGTPRSAGIDIAKVAFAEGDRRHLVIALHSRGVPFAQPDIFLESTGAGLPPAPVFSRGAAGLATLSIHLADPLPHGAPLILTLTDGTRAAEFAATP